MPVKKLVIALFIAVTLAVSVVLIGSAVRDPVTYHGTRLDPPMPAVDFTLRSAGGPVSRSDLEGKVVPLFFGYTSCPDVCPMTLLRLSDALEELGEARAEVQVVFVSVDPERDTPERASAYAAAVDPGFIGLSGTPEEIADVASEYGIYHARAEGGDATDYLVEHTMAITVLDQDGRAALLWSPDLTAEQMAEDLKTLVD